MATSKIESGIQLVSISHSEQQSVGANGTVVYYIDISDIVAKYGKVAVSGDLAAMGGSYASFALKYAYINGTSLALAFLNTATSQKTINGCEGHLICIP